MVTFMFLKLDVALALCVHWRNSLGHPLTQLGRVESWRPLLARGPLSQMIDCTCPELLELGGWMLRELVYQLTHKCHVTANGRLGGLFVLSLVAKLHSCDTRGTPETQHCWPVVGGRSPPPQSEQSALGLLAHLYCTLMPLENPRLGVRGGHQQESQPLVRSPAFTTGTNRQAVPRRCGSVTWRGPCGCVE